MLATYHNHSTWSDGKASIAAIIDAAAAMGIGDLGISDHWVLHPAGEQKSWAMPTGRLHAYVQELAAHRDELDRKKPPSGGGMTLRIGLEADWHPGRAVPLHQALDPLPFDYVLGSIHEVGGFAIDMSPAAWSRLTQEQRDEIHRQYWINMVGLAESGAFDIVSHIDLPKKFAFHPSIDLTREIHAALDAIAAARLVVEVNTSGWHKPCADAYPSIEILRECRRRDIPMTINADAHLPEHLLRDFRKAADRLAAAGYGEVARFAGRQARMEPLDEAVKGLS